MECIYTSVSLFQHRSFREDIPKAILSHFLSKMTVFRLSSVKKKKVKDSQECTHCIHTLHTLMIESVAFAWEGIFFNHLHIYLLYLLKFFNICKWKILNFFTFILNFKHNWINFKFKGMRKKIHATIDTYVYASVFAKKSQH